MTDLPYAAVVVNGTVVAKLDNNGIVETPNAMGAQLGDLPDEGRGPQLAQARAEHIAAAMGGKIVKAGTAMDQNVWKMAQNPFDDPAAEAAARASVEATNARREQEALRENTPPVTDIPATILSQMLIEEERV